MLPTRLAVFQSPPSRRAILAIGGCALAVVWIVVAVWIGQIRTIGRDAALREIRGFSNLLIDYADRTLEGVDLLLWLLATRLELVLSAGGQDASGALHAMLERDILGMPQVRRAFLIDATGRIVADSQFREPRSFSAADRPHFLVHRDDPAVGLHVSEPIRSRIDGDWSIILSRRLNATDGSFLGVVVAALRPEYFTEIFRASVDGRDTTIVLWHANSVVMATGAPDQPPAIGERLPMPSGLGREGVVFGHSPTFGTERIVAYARSSSYPTLIVVTRPLSAIHAAHADSERMIVAAGGVLSALIVAIGWLLLRQMQSLDARFRDGIERMTDGFVLLDDRERIIAWNSQAETLLPVAAALFRVGIPLRELVETLVARMRPDLPPGERDEEVRARYAAATSTEPSTFKTRDGRIVEAQTSATRFGGMVTLLRDVTDRERHQAALERALKVEREANELHRRFVTLASHEFRTPLAVIDGAAQRLLQEQASAPSGGAGKLERIRSAVRSMTMLIDRMLSSARLEAGAISVDMQPIDLRRLVLAACERQRQISPGFEIAAGVDDAPVPLLGDARLLEQVFGNLLSNAVKYSGRSRRVEVSIERAGNPAALRVAVQDRGLGIHADEIEKLFTRFFRARTAQGIAGTGIGLHLTRELVTLHGGRIEVESRLGEGTRFTVVLPDAAPAHAGAA